MSKMNVLAPGLRVVFVGYNPSHTSFESGFNYAGKSNRFYKVLFQSGLTHRLYSPNESRQLFADYGYGFTNIVSRPTARADELTKKDYDMGRLELRSTLEAYRPHIACYVGKGVYQQFSERRTNLPWGWQESDVIDGIRDFVAPSTSGLVRMKLQEQVEIYQKLRPVVEGLAWSSV